MEDPNVRSHVNAIMQAVMADLEATDDNLAPITEYAKARVQLMRIRQVRRGIFAELRSCLNPDALSRLVALDRYERMAHTKRRRASQKLSPVERMEG